MQSAARAATLLVVAAWLTGCAGTRQAVRDHTIPDDAVAVSVVDGEPLGREEALALLEQARHVYVAEEHGSALHHGAQLEVARLLHEAGVPVTLGIEWLPAEAQPALDAWVAGDLDEETFLVDVRWEQSWGHDFEAYAPIFRWSRDEGVPVRALNAPKGLAHRVASGDVGDLTPEERAALPPLDSSNPAHRAFFAEMMEHVAHAHGGGHGGGFDEEALERYYRAQLVWDEHMAREAARWLQSPGARGGALVVLAGGGHVRRGLGIPLRVEEATGSPFVIVLPVERDPEAWTSYLEDAPYPDREADLLWLGRP